MTFATEQAGHIVTRVQAEALTASVRPRGAA